MISKEVLLFAHYHTFIAFICFNSICTSFAAMVHVSLVSGPSQALDYGSPIFCCENLDIFVVSIGPFLFRDSYCSIYWNFTSSLLVISVWIYLSLYSHCLYYKSSNDGHLQAFRRCCGKWPVYLPKEDCSLDSYDFLRIQTFLYSFYVWTAYVALSLATNMALYILHFLGWMLYCRFANINILLIYIFASSMCIYLKKLNFSKISQRFFREWFKMISRYFTSSFMERMVVSSFIISFPFSVFLLLLGG
jgi:hypothetical protein